MSPNSRLQRTVIDEVPGQGQRTAAEPGRWRHSADRPHYGEPRQICIQMFVRILAIDEGLAAALVANDVTTLEEVAYIPSDELLAMQGLDDPEFSRTVIGDE